MTIERYLDDTGSASTLTSPFPLVGFVPAMLAEDSFIQRWLDGLDHVLGPMIVQVDCLPEYLDPELTTRSMLEYLGFWISAQVLPDMTDDEVRGSVLVARQLNALRGTVNGIHAWAQNAGVGDVDVEDTGGVYLSPDATEPSTWPAAPPPKVTVTLPPAAANSEQFERMEEALRNLVPAGTVIEVKGGPARRGTSRKNGARDN